jgi:hypothetical protein
MGIPSRDQAILGQPDERKRALRLRNRFDQGVVRCCRLRAGVQMQQDFGVARGLKN